MTAIKPGFRLATALLLLTLVSSAAGAQGAAAPENGSAPIFRDPDAPLDARVNDIVSRLTLEEKASQMVNQARAIPRLGIPAYNWWNEALHGVARAGLATVFPEPVGLGASFDPGLIHAMADVISTEARVKNNIALRAGRHSIYEGLTFWSPNINIFRDPRWGRGQETYGEDPYLTGRMAEAFVTGMQGADPRYLKTVATPKHYAVHSGPEPTRHEVDVPVSKHDMADTYLPAFRAAMVNAKAESIMCAYNSIDGQPACANEFLLRDTLRRAWGFKGFMVSDCDAIADIADGLAFFTTGGHKYVGTFAEAAAVSVKLGVDNDCADFSTSNEARADYARYYDAVKQGLLPEADLDASLKRLFAARVRLGLFDPPERVPYAQIPDGELDSAAHRTLALKVARETMVLLKNNGILPLAANAGKIAVVGPLADQDMVLRGNYNGTPSRSTTALDGIRKQFPDATVTFEPGTNFLRPAAVIPTDVLSTADGKPGLAAAFYGEEGFAGTPILARVDPNVAYDMDVASDLPTAAKFGLTETGFLTPAESGDYKIGLWGQTGRLFIDGKLVVNVQGRQKSPLTAVVTLEQGRKYTIRIEHDYTSRVFSLRLVWQKLDPGAEARAAAAAKDADVVIAVVGITSSLEGEEMYVDVPGFKGGDRTSLDLPAPEEELLKAVKAAGKKLIVVLMNGSALSVNWADRNADAILDAWYSGEEGGTAIAETIAGGNNPAGRLPVTFYTGVEQLPPFEDYAMTGRTYRYFAGKPLYPFGYGLSYSTFRYSKLKVTKRLRVGGKLDIAVDVTNTSARDGDEVAEVYLGFPGKMPGVPLRALRGIDRVHLTAGETRRLHFTLEARELSAVTPQGDVMVRPGVYSVSVGGGQPGTGAPSVAARFRITGAQKLAE
jgi:beta-glucosidase